MLAVDPNIARGSSCFDSSAFSVHLPIFGRIVVSTGSLPPPTNIVNCRTVRVIHQCGSAPPAKS